MVIFVSSLLLSVSVKCLDFFFWKNLLRSKLQLGFKYFSFIFCVINEKKS